MKRALIYIVLVILSFLSCKAQKIERDAVCGTFYKQNKDQHFSSSYMLKLNKDGSFELTEKYQDANPQCKGQWELKDDKTIFLHCEEVTDATKMLSNAYMSQRQHVLTIVNKDKLKYKDVILKRQK